MRLLISKFVRLLISKYGLPNSHSKEATEALGAAAEDVKEVEEVEEVEEARTRHYYLEEDTQVPPHKSRTKRGICVCAATAL